jgi:hypothetical protein
MKMKNKLLQFADSFGIKVEDLPAETINLINKYNFDLIDLSSEERDRLLILIIKKIQNDKQVIAGPDRKLAWQKGWAENLRLYKNSHRKEEALIPKFLRAGQEIRWKGHYYKTSDPNFELNYIDVLRSFVFQTYFSDLDNLYEFGAGTGFNLLHFSRLNRNLNLIGTDFVDSAVDLMNEVAKDFDLNLESYVFDMLNPKSSDLTIQKNSGVVTFGSLEQLGSKISPIIEYFVNGKPNICVHVEPMIELYNPESLEDYLAVWFQGKRGYTSGLINEIQKLETQSKAKIIKLQRLNFGSLMMEGFNMLVWKPI